MMKSTPPSSDTLDLAKHLTISIQEQQAVKSPELAAKQARLIQILRAGSKPSDARADPSSQSDAEMTPEQEAEEGSYRLAKMRHQNEQFRKMSRPKK